MRKRGYQPIVKNLYQWEEFERQRKRDRRFEIIVVIMLPVLFIALMWFMGVLI